MEPIHDRHEQRHTIIMAQRGELMGTKCTKHYVNTKERCSFKENMKVFMEKGTPELLLPG